MDTAFESDFAAAEDLFDEACGGEVAYDVDGVEVATLTAVVTVATYRVATSHGSVEEIVARDYEVTAEDLVVDETEIEPEPGHRIRETIRGSSRTFEVAALGDRPCWQPADAEGRRIIIHAVEVGV
jgi:hypothetical protein